MSLGMDVRIKFKKDSPLGEFEEMRHNVTEIHYNFPSIGVKQSVAFESDVHGTGGTIPIEYIEEFEAVAATVLHKSY